MTDLHITEIIAALSLCVGYLAVVLGNALADRIRYGSMLASAQRVTPEEIEASLATESVLTESALEDLRKLPPRVTPLPVAKARRARPKAAEREPSADSDLVRDSLVGMGYTIAIAQAAARHARATCGAGADAETLIREALKACPRSA